MKKAQKALEAAREVFASCPPWTVLHNAIFGVQGVCADLFKSEEERIAFSQTEQFAEIWRMIEELQGTSNDSSGKTNIRLPKSLHFALTKEAEAEGVSLNTLIIAKLAASLGSLVH